MALLPALHLLPLRTFVGERFLYLPMMGFSVFLACAVHRFRLGRWLVYGWIVFLGVATVRQVPTWHDESTLWSAAIRVDPQNAFAQACYADTRRNPLEAIDRYRVVLSLPATAEIRFSAEVNVAHLLLVVGQNQEALSYSQMALKINPSDLNALFDECVAFHRVGKNDRAERIYQALRDEPQTPDGFIQALGLELGRGLGK